MQLLCYVAFLLLCSLSFLSSVFPLNCKSTQYQWSVAGSMSCCEKCKPGQRMERRTLGSCAIECKPCTGDRYIDTHNVEMSCSICNSCTQPNMEYKSRCNITQNAECRCKTGYSCKDKPCTQCVRIPTTTKPTLPPFTTTFRTIEPRPIGEKAWFLVIIALLCIGIALVVVTKIKPLLRWIRSKDSFFFTDKSEQSYSEDDDPSKPVQEVCGECDQPIDVCLKC